MSEENHDWNLHLSSLNLKLNKAIGLLYKIRHYVPTFLLKTLYYTIFHSHNQCPHYLNDVFMKAPESSSSLRNSYQKLQQPFHKTNTGQNALSFIGPTLWNKVPKKSKE